MPSNIAKYYVVIADYRLAGVYKRESAAITRIKELLRLPIKWTMKPTIFPSTIQRTRNPEIDAKLSIAKTRANLGYFGKVE